MPSGPEHLVSQPAYSTEFTRARALLLAHPGRWRVIYHYDGDGIASASSAVRMLGRLGYPVQATPLIGVERARVEAILDATRTPVLVLDTGASWLDRFSRHPQPVIILDHHQYPGAPVPPALPAHVAFVNPLDWGVDGMTELCGATASWLFSIFVDPVNWDNAPWGLSGAIADRQHVGGFRGLNARLVEEAVGRGLLVREEGLPLFGATLSEALARSIDPFLRGLSGRPVEADRFLHALGLEPRRPIASLDAAERARLGAAILARLVQQGTRPEFVEAFHAPRYRLTGPGIDAEELANLQNATGRGLTPSEGIALALGDEGALAHARAAEEAWRTGILNGLRRLEESGAQSMHALQWFESPDGPLAGTQAGLAMNYLLDAGKPVVVFTSAGEQTKVSGRGTGWLVGRGLDLADAFRAAAHAVGGEGGGHRVASGATIPTAERTRFLEEADAHIQRQLAPAVEAP
jgi:single-stranded-DNA-specific exonuclease